MSRIPHEEEVREEFRKAAIQAAAVILLICAAIIGARALGWT